MQAHIPILETSPENRAALLAGLQYLTNISFVDDEEVCSDVAWGSACRPLAFTEEHVLHSAVASAHV